MNCKEALPLIEDFHFGELNRKSAAQVAAHLSSCPNCARALQALVDEERIYQSYSRALERDIEARPLEWHRVRSGLQVVRTPATRPSFFAFLEGWLPGSRPLRYAVFAAFVACISIGATLFAVRMFAPSVPPSSNSLEAALQSVHRAEAEYLEALRILSAIVEKQKESLDPAQRAELERNLRALDEGIALARQAYHAHPSDPELGFHMLTAYREKVDLLQELATS